MWFDEIMDDCKEALRISDNHKGIFIPVIINFVLTLLFIAYCVFIGIALFRKISNIPMYSWNSYNTWLHQIPPILIIALLNYIIVVLFSSIMKAGSINLYRYAIDNKKLKASYFMEGIKTSFLKILGGTLFTHIIALFASPIILIFFLIFSFTLGLLSPSWGMLFLSTVSTVFLFAWPIIVVEDNMGPIQSILTSVKLGWRNFLGMFVILLGNALISKYVLFIFGPLVAFICGFLLMGIVHTYFKVVVLLIYKRKKENLLPYKSREHQVLDESNHSNSSGKIIDN
ncbi:hypothetical protein [Sporosalibacterium faouarense]|uniref:hypothetical protein n=1 Tax=Sporosalibacterium faouarense TaxID=516123 RepID=UPI00192BFAFB|nr:hypothetical protein [Sporosalibacterium faouarense]